MEDDSENPSLEIGSSMKRSVSGDGKLCIKLKFPIPAGGDEVVAAQKNDQPRVCNVCNKGFSSGKALGGHMRVHVQENRELKNKPYKSKKKRLQLALENRDDPNAAGYEKPTCSICGKNFPSMKSLFGHMRCHPERDYRGIQPPLPVMAAENSSSSSVSDAEESDGEAEVGGSNLVTDLVQSLPRWSVTAKRGRKSVDCEMTEEEAHAVHHLMSLAGGDSLESGLTYKHIIEASNSNSLTNRPEIELKKPRFGKAPAKSGELEMRDFIDYNDESDSTGSEQLIMNFKCKSSMMMTMKSKKKRKKLSDLESAIPADHDQIPAGIAVVPPEDSNKYKCSTCNKCFQTHQALGGHRSSHYKANKTCQAIEESCSVGGGADQDELQAKLVSRSAADELKDKEGAGSSKPADSIHQCKICSKIFLTGQALGGHKRCHWSGSGLGAETPPSQAASPGEASHTGRKILGFDLNELPPMEDEDGIESEHVGGYGYYASSSYNSSIA